MRIQTPPERLRCRAGFTLVELLVVLALLGVLAGMVAPRFRGTVRSVETEEVATRLRSRLERFRFDAARGAARIEVAFSPAGRPELMVDVFEPARHPAWDFTPVSPGELRMGLRRSTLSFGLEGSIEADPPQIVFHPDGTSTEAVVRVRGERDRTFVLTVRPHGVVVEAASQ